MIVWATVRGLFQLFLSLQIKRKPRTRCNKPEFPNCHIGSKISASSLFQIKKSKASVTNQHNRTWQTSVTTKYNNQVLQYVTNQILQYMTNQVQQYVTSVYNKMWQTSATKCDKLPSSSNQAQLSIEAKKESFVFIPIVNVISTWLHCWHHD